MTKRINAYNQFSDNRHTMTLETIVNHTYEQVVEFEKQLDEKAQTLADKLNEICSPLRERNRKRWERFARKCKLPIIGNLYYQIFRGPKETEDDLYTWNDETLKKERELIEEGAKELERMKSTDLEHWGDELVKAELLNDPGGYYSPPGKIKRRECYSEEFCSRTKKQLSAQSKIEHEQWMKGVSLGISEGCPPEIIALNTTREHYIVETPDKYDFRYGGLRTKEGIYIMDQHTKESIQLNESNFFCSTSPHSEKGIIRTLEKKFRRTWCVYTRK